MLGAYSLLKVIELELQGYLSATKGRVVCDHLVVLIIFSCSALFFFCFLPCITEEQLLLCVCVFKARGITYMEERKYTQEKIKGKINSISTTLEPLIEALSENIMGVGNP